MNKNSVIYYIIFLSIVIISGCKSTKNVTSFENILYPEGRFFIVKPVDETTRKRFEYFLFEASRFKMLGDFNKAVLYYKEAIGVDTTCASCYFELAQLIFQSGDSKNAELYGFKAVQLDPTNEWFLSFLSKVYHNNKKPELALEASKFLVKLKPNNVEYIYNLAQFQYSLGQYKESIESLNKIEKLLGKNEFLSLEKHSVHIQNKDFKNAEKELRSLINAFPGNLDYRVYLGDFFTQRRRLKEAYEQYNIVIKGDPNNSMAYFSLANYYLLSNDIPNFKSSLQKGFGSSGGEFEAKFQRLLPFLMNISDEENPLEDEDFEGIFKTFIATHPHESKVYLLYANYLSHKGRINEALLAYENSLLLDEKQEDVWQDFLFQSLNNHEKDVFLAHCKNGVKAFPENPIIHYLTGIAYSFNDNRKAAIFHLNEVIKYSKDNARLEAQTYGFLGDLYYQEGDKDKSFESYQKSIDLDDKQVGILNNYAYYLSVEEINLDKAERMISKVIELEPRNATYLDTYAWVLFKRERYFEALFIIEQAISNGGDKNGVILEHYGDILYKNGNVEKAVEFWIKASETNDEDLSESLNKKIKEQRYIK